MYGYLYSFNLTQEKGVEFTINGQPKVLFGTIAVISADNLGSLLLGGFKESCSAYRMCRHCLCTKDESTIKVSLYECSIYCNTTCLVYRKEF